MKRLLIRISALLTGLLCFGLIAMAEAGPVHAVGEFDLIYTGGLKEAQPGESVTLPFRVENNTSDTLELRGQLDLPEGWDTVVSQRRFTVAPRDTYLQLITLRISGFAASGNYLINYLVADPDHPGIRAETEVEVVVEELSNLIVEELSVPAYAVVGETTEITYRVTNASNSATGFEVELDNAAAWRIKQDPAGPERDTHLEPGEAVDIVVTVTPEFTRRVETEELYIRVRAWSTDLKDEARDTAFTRLELVGGLEAPDPGIYYPIDFGLRAGLDNGPGGGQDTNYQFSGAGPLLADGSLTFDFDLSGALFGETSMLGSGRYALGYHPDEDSSVFFGERSFGLSDMTVRSQTGLGLEARSRLSDGLDLKAFTMKSALGSFDGSFTGLGAEWVPGGRDPTGGADRIFRLSVLSSDMTIPFGTDLDTTRSIGGTVIALGGEAELLGHDVEAEVATGAGVATKLSIGGETAGFNYRLSNRRADPLFPGPFRDRELTNISVTRDLTGDIRTFFNSSSSKRNLNEDPDFGDAREFGRLNYGITWRLAGTRFTLDRLVRDEAELLGANSFSLTDEQWRIGAGRSFGAFDLDLTLGNGTTTNDETGESFPLNELFGALSWSPGGNLSLGATFSSRNDNSVLDDTSLSTTEYGLDLNYRVSDKTDVTLALRNSSGDFGGTGATSGLDINHRLSDSQTLRLSLQSDSGGGSFGGGGGMSVQLSYVMAKPLRYKIGERDLVGGTLQGRVMRTDLPESGVEGVVVRVGQYRTNTDSAGKFEIPFLPPGSYRIYLDRTSYGIDLIPSHDLPVEVVISDDEEEQIELGLVKAALLEGRVLVPDSVSIRDNFTAEDGEELLEESEMRPVAGVVVEVSRADGKTMRRVSDHLGRFRFKQLVPGQWKLNVLAYSVPPSYREPGTMTLELSPGEQRTYDVELQTRKKRVEFKDSKVRVSD